MYDCLVPTGMSCCTEHVKLKSRYDLFLAVWGAVLFAGRLNVATRYPRCKCHYMRSPKLILWTKAGWVFIYMHNATHLADER